MVIIGISAIAPAYIDRMSQGGGHAPAENAARRGAVAATDTLTRAVRWLRWGKGSGSPAARPLVDLEVIMSSAPLPGAVPIPALPASVRLGVGGGGLAVARVTSRTGAAEIYLRGAHVTAWAPANSDPVIWMSSQTRFTPESPLRGGVPLCFPWFGANAADLAAPSHGFARLAQWELTAAREDGDDVVVTFRLSDTAETHASVWPHRFEAEYTVTVGARLTLSLRVANHDAETVSFEEAFHTYLGVRDIRSTEISGLEGVPFLDKVDAFAVKHGEDRPVGFSGETDRIYYDTTGTTTVIDAGRTITVVKQNSSSAVVWNPWAEKAAAMTDFGDDEWGGMVCLETANLGRNAVSIAPGERHTMTATYAVGFVE